MSSAADAEPGWRGKLDRITSDPQLGLVSLFSALISMTVFPFVLFRAWNGQWTVAIIDAIIVIAVAAVGIFAWRPGRAPVAGMLMAVVTTSSCLVVSLLYARHGLLWSYAVLTTNFLLTSRRIALAANIIVFATLGTHPEVFTNHVERVVFLSSGVLVSLCSYIFSLQSSRQRLALERLATHDSLTRALNRRAFDTDLFLTLQNHQLSGAPCMLAMIDIDHFKSINDAYGHEVGDDVLVSLVRTIQQHHRRQDRLYRFGGEEFVMLMPDTGREAARHALEALRARVADALRRPDGKPVTISIGAALLSDADQGAYWLARADAAMYQAKRSGRNRVVLDGDFSASGPAEGERRSLPDLGTTRS
ncbi:MAG: GGDEF domain-containing protein [Xanthomonadales bacterium]|nr:GGDEF domain-containing protein [Xanthomonadales bacterium]